jgi:NDP-sugar pyrophosphorylase family protein
MHAILLVGGKGARLMPYTRSRPKGLLEFGQYTLLEIILRRLGACGFERVTLCVSHLGEMIQAAFGDGGELGLAIDYSVDDRPLGTAAPLLLVPDWHAPAVVMNGDLLTTVDFADLYRRHHRDGGLLTVAFQRHWLSSGMGLLRVLGDQVQSMREKPTFEWNVCSGIYVADPLVRTYIASETPTDMPDLINLLAQSGEAVSAYQFNGYWCDVGTPARYQRARTDFLADPELYLAPQSREPAANGHAPDIDMRLLPSHHRMHGGLDITMLGQAEPDQRAIGSWP